MPSQLLTSDTSAASGMTVTTWLFSQVAERGDAIALQEGETRISYRALERRVNAFAHWLTRQNLARGDRLAILSENRREFVEVELAAARLGVVTACLNWRQSDVELTHAIRLVEPKLVVVSERHAATFARVDHGVSTVIGLGEEYERALARAADAGDVPDLARPEDGLVILYTSGTTGLPKGAVISHRATIARAMINAIDRPVDRDEAYVAWGPLFHMGSADSVFSTLLRGGKVVLVDGFPAAEIAEIVRTERLGHLHLNSAVIDRLLEQVEAHGTLPKGVRYVGVMADLVPRQTMAKLTTLMNAPYANTFGSTETGSVPASRGNIGVGIAPVKLSKEQNSFCVLRLVDENDRDVPDGEPGEALIRSPALFSGYWNAPETNAEIFRDGWYHMGDVLRRNPDRTLDFVDRRKYLIKSGGENIYPAEIESVLLASPRIACAAVVKRVDRRWGEIPVAFVVARDAGLTADDVIALCRGRIAGYKVPKEIRFVAASEVPLSTSGKVVRHELEKRLIGGDDSPRSGS